MPVVALSSLEQCGKTCEIQHTPTPVRVPMVLHGPIWRPRDDPGGHGLLPVRAR